MKKQEVLLIASNNKHKIDELKSMLLQTRFTAISMAEAGFFDEIEETGKTFEENAILKAKALADKHNSYVFADDSGLEVEALDFRPGVYSARYAGKGATDCDRITKLLNELKDEINRNARFVSVIAIAKPDGSVETFRGEVYGKITKSPRGTNGFGYDPVFIPEGLSKTFAELPSEIKNKISHRANSARKMLEALSSY